MGTSAELINFFFRFCVVALDGSMGGERRLDEKNLKVLSQKVMNYILNVYWKQEQIEFVIESWMTKLTNKPHRRRWK